MAGFLGTKKAVTGKADTSSRVERGGGSKPDGLKVNCMLERCDYRDATESAHHLAKQGKEACENSINMMFRIKETADGKWLKGCVFHSAFMASIDTSRAAKDQQIVSVCATLAGEQDQALAELHADIFDSEDWPEDAVLRDMVGTMVGIEIGVFADKATGKVNEFIRKIGKPYEFGSAEQATSGQTAGGDAAAPRRRRSRA